MSDPSSRPPVTGPDVPGADDLWRVLVDSLGRDYAGVDHVGPGRLEVIDEDGEIVTIHLTPQQWRSLVISAEHIAVTDSGEDAWGPGDGPSIAYGDLEEQIDSRQDGELHVVLHGGSLHQSVRAELPPVRGAGPLDATLDGDGDWYAVAPDGTDTHP